MNFPYYKQLDSMDCGPACLRMIARHYGKVYTARTLFERSHNSLEGVSLMGLSDAAESIGFRAIGARVSFETLREECPLPCVIHWKQNHFAVVYKIRKRRNLFGLRKKGYTVHVADPSLGLMKYSEVEFGHGWQQGDKSGLALLLEPKPEFYEFEETRSDSDQFSSIFKFLYPYKNLVLQLVLGFVFASILQLIFPILTQAIVDKGIHYKDVSFLTLILIAQLFLIFGQASVNFIQGWISLHLTARIDINLLSHFLFKLLNLPIRFFDTKKIGDLAQRMEDNSRIQRFLTSTLIQIVFSIGSFTLFGLVIAYFNAKLFLYYLIGSIAYAIWVVMFLRYRRTLDNKRFLYASNNQSNVYQLFTGIQEIKLNNCERQKRWEWERIQASIFKVNVKSLMVGQVQSAGGVLINGVKNIAITYIAAKGVIDGELTLGMMLSVQYMIGQMNVPIESLIMFLTTTQDAKLSYERLREVQQIESEHDGKSDSDVPANADIVIKDMSFQYERYNSLSIIQNLNLVIERNKTTAIVGTSGSGKTTLLKLLLGFYEPTTGTINIGMTPLKAINKKKWRDKVGAVMQDGFLFSDSIANNIALGAESIDKLRLIQAAKSANIHEFIDTLPAKYRTIIGMEGHSLSQGQKQRILIARAIYKNPEFIFFDEATNALDSNNESAIVERLKDFFVGKTVVVVAHRLSTIRNADKIIVLENGMIAEEGSHEELIAKKGAYSKLINNQLSTKVTELYA